MTVKTDKSNKSYNFCWPYRPRSAFFSPFAGMSEQDLEAVSFSADVHLDLVRIDLGHEYRPCGLIVGKSYENHKINYGKKYGHSWAIYGGNLVK